MTNTRWRPGRFFSLAASLALLCSNSVGAVIAQSTTTQQIPSPPILNNPVVLTDTTGWGGQLGFLKNRKTLEGPPDMSPWLFHGEDKSVERDSRYSFTGHWSYFDDIDKFVARLQDKMPDLAKVTGELKSPCGQIPQTMPPVPDLPKPEALAKKAQPQPAASGPWLAVSASGAVSTAGKGDLVMSHAVQCFTSSAQSGRYIVGAPGSVLKTRAMDDVVLKVGRAYVYNGDGTSDLEVESGRIKVILPAGSSGIIDTAPNGLTEFSALTSKSDRAIRVVDLCNSAIELGKPAPGSYLTIAPEDSMAEDLLIMHGVEQKIDTITRNEAYLLVKGNFCVMDACLHGVLLQNQVFNKVPVLSQQKARILAVAQEHPWKKESGAVSNAAAMSGNTSALENSRKAVFMPTRGARYGRLTANELMLADGAVLVKGGEQAVIVSTEVNHQKVMTQIKNGAVVMISALDGRLTALNLTDASPGSCSIYIPPKAGYTYNKLSVNMGQVAEVYINDGLEPESTILSYRVLDRVKLADTLGLVISQYDYLAAMKRFNLSFALPQPEMNKVMKTMAATAYVMQGRSSR